MLAFEPNQGKFLGIPLGTSVNIFPIQGWVSLTANPWQWLHHLLLPAYALALGFTGFYARFVRALVLEQLDEDYVRTARSKGAGRWRVLRSHVGRVVAPSIITMLGLDLGAAIGGVLFVELVFGLPGLGFVAVNSIENLDYPVTVGVVTFTGLLTVGAMTLADLAVAVLDPRVEDPASDVRFEVRSGLAVHPGGRGLGVDRTEVMAGADGIYWLEHRFDEGRSCVIPAPAGGGAPRPVTPDGVDVGTLAWEYGGGSYLICGPAVIYADRDDQRLYRLRGRWFTDPALPGPALAHELRFADGSAAPTAAGRVCS